MLIDSDTSARSDSSSDEDNDVVDVTHERKRKDGKQPPGTEKVTKKRERDDHDESAAKRHKRSREANGNEKKTHSTNSDNGQRKTLKTHLRDSDDEQENVGADNENEHSDIVLNLSSHAQPTHASGGHSQQANYLPGYSWQFVSPSAPSAPFMSFVVLRILVLQQHNRFLLK